MFRSGRSGFVGGFVVATVLCAAIVYSAGELYTPSPDGDWIRDPLVYAPGSNDQVNVLGDLQPGAPDVMFLVSLRLNSLVAAGKKQNWEVAEHEADEIEEAFDRLMITRPALSEQLEPFLTGNLDPVKSAITSQDKDAFAGAIDTMVTACNSCHTAIGVGFLEVKPGKPVAGLRF